MTTVTFRQAATADATAVHRLISDNLEVGHLLPRTIDDIVEHAARFLVAEHDGARHRLRRAGAAQQDRRRGPVARRRSARPRTSDRSASRHRAGVRRGVARLCHAVRVHAPALALREDGLHDRAAHVGAGEDRARLHGVPAVPPLRTVRRHAAAARRACAFDPNSRPRSFTAAATWRRAARTSSGCSWRRRTTNERTSHAVPA